MMSLLLFQSKVIHRFKRTVSTQNQIWAVYMRSRTTLQFIIIIIITITASCTGAQNFRRICETQGTCINCGDDRFSYYGCRSQQDCFTGEVCTADGFCCPVSAFSKTAPSSSNQDFEFVGVPALKYQTELLTPCPDGSTWLRQCATDSDCIFGDEICAEGKCCSVCSQRRRQVLNDLPTNNLVGVYIPQCEPPGKHYRSTQCRTGTDECWCVSQFGRIIGSLKPKTVDLHAACDALRLALKRSAEEEKKIYQKVWERTDLRRKQENLASLKEENESFNVLSKEHAVETKQPSHYQLQTVINEIRTKCVRTKHGQCPERPEQLIYGSKLCYCDGDCPDSQKCCPASSGGWACTFNVSNVTTTTDAKLFSTPPTHHSVSPSTSPLLSSGAAVVKIECADNEEYVDCVDECQPTCSSGTSNVCPVKQCIGGCHCKSGFIRQSGSAESPCIPQSHCPQQLSQSDSHCSDPLREFKACGPSCPISCTSHVGSHAKCNTERCVEGCFCKIPYILENGDDSVRSRCILPSQCPLLEQGHTSINGSDRISSPAPDSSTPFPFPEYRYSSQPLATQCSDPLKNFQTCGSGCPAGCNNRIAAFCGTQCIAGCFCRSPYILQDAYNMNSRCVLPHQCQSLTVQQQICSDPRKQWTHCFSQKCARSCSNPEATCPPGDCAPGCLCREPYLLYDARDPSSRCVLPSECGSQCADPLKEYQACASSCPMGCNNRTPKTCSPCVSGCFCKLGLVFEDAVNWRNSRCVPLNQCPSTAVSSSLPIALSPKTTPANLPQCPATTIDLNGRFCNFDSDCPTQQRCCRSALFALVSSQQSRCTCTDPNAFWDPCGTLCPEYCGQPSVPVCSSTCNPGCHCAAGYVKARNDVMAPCVLRVQCLQTEPHRDVAAGDMRRTTKAVDLWKDIATVKMLSAESKVTGDVKIKEISKDKIKLEGAITGLPEGDHALIVHQSGDLSNSCANIGPILVTTSKENISAIFGNVKAAGSENATIDREIHWPSDVSLIGHSLVLHKLSVMEWSLRSNNVLPLACGTIGFASQ